MGVLGPATGDEKNGGILVAASVLSADQRIGKANRNLQINALSNIASGGITAVLGLAYWALAARLYPASEVGAAAALISAGLMLATLSNLSLGSMYERFLSSAGTSARPLLIRGFLLVAAFALLASIVMILVGPREQLFATTSAMVAYPVFVVVLAVYALQDQTASGLGVARWAAAKNIFHAVIKLALLCAGAFVLAEATTITLSWAIPAAVATAVLMWALLRSIGRRSRFAAPPALPPRRELWSFFATSYGITALTAITPLVLPLIVVAQLGTEANAYFAISWSIAAALFTVLHMVVSPYVAEAARHPEGIPSLTRKIVLILAVLVAGGAFFLVVIAPPVLGFLGEQYRADGAPLLFLIAAFTPLFALEVFYTAIARIRRKLVLAVATQTVNTIIVMTGVILLIGDIGIVSIGWSYLAAYAVTAAILIVPLLRGVREITRDPEAILGEPLVV